MNREEFLITISRLFQPGEVRIVLVGGCSRAGKSTLTRELSSLLNQVQIPNLVVSLDSWIVSYEKRPMNGGLLDRFEVPAILQAINALSRGERVCPPVYDPVSRRRISERADSALLLGEGILLVEGVPALAISELRNLAKFRVFVEIDEAIRLNRLRDFYHITKGLTLDNTEAIIRERELEEVKLINSTSNFADIIVKSDFSLKISSPFVGCFE